ncbi:unnamed protein product [Sphagnum jensenii]|uniref:Uncharacterized protein n=1 Tax=Sphagnum jensenii TaxID=128206 RepID=A0ABP0W3P2_9BRYO
MDNSESNIDLTQILAALQHLQQENAVLRNSTSSPLLQDFNAFMAKFEVVFGDSDKARTSANKLRRLKQGTQAALINQFRCGLRDDVQDLLLTLTDPSSFSEAITQAIRCDNRLFERRQEMKVTSNTQQTTSVARPASFGPAPMQIDTAKFKPLTEAEKLR